MDVGICPRMIMVFFCKLGKQRPQFNYETDFCFILMETIDLPSLDAILQLPTLDAILSMLPILQKVQLRGNKRTYEIIDHSY